MNQLCEVVNRIQSQSVYVRRSEMAKPIYKLFVAKPSQASYKLSQEEQQKIFAKIKRPSKKLAANRLLPVTPAGLRSNGPSGALRSTRTLKQSRSIPRCSMS